MRVIALLILCLPSSLIAAEALVAVAANFTSLLKDLVTEFESESGHRVSISPGSTGKLFAQIINGAPFDIFLAADQARPERLENSGHGVAGSRFTYATGRLVLLTIDAGLIRNDLRETLLQERLRVIAIANPTLAPYGAAAESVLQSLGIRDEIASKIVMGENIGQTFSHVATENAGVGFVGLASVMAAGNQSPDSYVEIPPHLYAPIRQDVILLNHGKNNVAAREFMIFLRSEAVRERIASAGYLVDL